MDARRTIRRGAVVGLLLVFAGASASGPSVSAEPEQFVTGSGRGDARVVRLGPSSAQLGLTPSAALGLADFLGTVSRAESRPFDWAALGSSVEDADREYLDHGLARTYPTLRVESTDEGAAEGTTESRPPFRHHARADATPHAVATTRLASLEIPGVLRVSDGVAEAFAGLVDVSGERLREAGGRAAIGELELGAGAAVLRGLRWEVRQRTDADQEVTVDGRFVVGSAVVGGESIEGPITGEALAGLFDALDAALAPSGLRLDPPALERRAGSAAITPLSVRIVDSEVGHVVVAPVVERLQPVRQPVFDGVISNCEDCAALVLAADVTLGVVSGSGRLDVELGGASGFTEGERYDNPFLSGAAFGSPPSETLFGPGPAGGAGSSATPAAPGRRDAPNRASERVEAVGGSRPVASSGVWAASLLALAGLATGVVRGLGRIRLRRLGIGG